MQQSPTTKTRNSQKRLLFAVLYSLPLVPFLFVSATSLNGSFTQRDIALAAPFVIESFIFYALYSLSDGRKNTNNDQRKAAMMLAVGLYLILGIPIIGLTLLQKSASIPKGVLSVTAAYSLANILFTTWHIGDSTEKMTHYFLRRFALPGGIALAAYLLLAIISPTTINPVAGYYLLKNFMR